MFDLINAFSLVRSPTESALLLRDLLTAAEIKNLAKRLRIAKLLVAGKRQWEIQEELRCSFGTITKVSLWLNSGGEGLRRIISRLPKRRKKVTRVSGRPGYRWPQLLMAVAQDTLTERETHQLKRFLEKISDKEISDRSLREAMSEFYRDKKGK